MQRFGWDKAELARQAGINPHTASRAVDGDTISPRVARQIAQALSIAAGEPVQVGDVRGLVVKR